MTEDYNNLVPPFPSQDKAKLGIKLIFLTWIIDLFVIDIFHILDENKELPISIVVEAIMHSYHELKEGGDQLANQLLLHDDLFYYYYFFIMDMYFFYYYGYVFFIFLSFAWLVFFCQIFFFVAVIIFFQ